MNMAVSLHPHQLRSKFIRALAIASLFLIIGSALALTAHVRAQTAVVEADGTLRRIAVPLLMYHYISTPPEDADIYRQDLSVTPETFRQQMQYLADNGYHTISLYDLTRALRQGMPLPSDPVVLTFDDGYRDAYENAFPVLKEFGFTGTFFVITTRLDVGDPAYLSWTQAAEMAAAGMSIESHTKDHPNLRERDNDFLIYQILGSVESIEAHTGHRPHMLAYPSGRWDAHVLAVLPEVGIWAAVVTEGGIEHTTDSIYLLRRVRISGETDLPMFAALLGWEWDRADNTAYRADDTAYRADNAAYRADDITYRADDGLLLQESHQPDEE